MDHLARKPRNPWNPRNPSNKRSISQSCLIQLPQNTGGLAGRGRHSADSPLAAKRQEQQKCSLFRIAIEEPAKFW